MSVSGFTLISMLQVIYHQVFPNSGSVSYTHLDVYKRQGTDGVLLGAWVDVVSARNILDVGTGTGLLSLMMAQRCNAQIRAGDIDADAVEPVSYTHLSKMVTSYFDKISVMEAVNPGRCLLYTSRFALCA